MKLAWVEDRQIARVSSESISTPTRRETLGQVEENPLVTYFENPIVRWGSFAGGVLGAYHGYKRNDSIPWAIGWSILGFWFWPVTIPISIAQGFGDPKSRRSNPTKRRYAVVAGEKLDEFCSSAGARGAKRWFNSYDAAYDFQGEFASKTEEGAWLVDTENWDACEGSESGKPSVAFRHLNP